MSFFSPNPENGFIYVLSNPSMPGLLKIGYSIRDVHDRVAELSSPSGVPSEFVFEALFISPAAREDESRIHEALSEYRVGNREFFEVDSGKAIRKIIDVIGYPPLETRHEVTRKSSGTQGAYREAARYFSKRR